MKAIQPVNRVAMYFIYCCLETFDWNDSLQLLLHQALFASSLRTNTSKI